MAGHGWLGAESVAEGVQRRVEVEGQVRVGHQATGLQEEVPRLRQLAAQQLGPQPRIELRRGRRQPGDPLRDVQSGHEPGSELAPGPAPAPLAQRLGSQVLEQHPAGRAVARQDARHPHARSFEDPRGAQEPRAGRPDLGRIGGEDGAAAAGQDDAGVAARRHVARQGLDFEGRKARRGEPFREAGRGLDRLAHAGLSPRCEKPPEKLLKTRLGDSVDYHARLPGKRRGNGESGPRVAQAAERFGTV